jgi:hypothetical protein
MSPSRYMKSRWQRSGASFTVRTCASRASIEKQLFKIARFKRIAMRRS